jgi:hypothetical protein
MLGDPLELRTQSSGHPAKAAAEVIELTTTPLVIV